MTSVEEITLQQLSAHSFCAISGICYKQDML